MLNQPCHNVQHRHGGMWLAVVMRTRSSPNTMRLASSNAGSCSMRRCMARD